MTERQLLRLLSHGGEGGNVIVFVRTSIAPRRLTNGRSGVRDRNRWINTQSSLWFPRLIGQHWFDDSSLEAADSIERLEGR